MTENTTAQYGDPTEWHWIPEAWTEAFTAAITAHGHTVTDAHDTAVILNVPGLPEDHEWYIGKPTFHGMWSYGIANERGHADHITWLAADATDPQAIADLVHAVLTDAPLGCGWMCGSTAVWMPASA